MQHIVTFSSNYYSDWARLRFRGHKERGTEGGRRPLSLKAEAAEKTTEKGKMISRDGTNLNDQSRDLAQGKAKDLYSKSTSHVTEFDKQT